MAFRTRRYCTTHEPYVHTASCTRVERQYGVQYTDFQTTQHYLTCPTNSKHQTSPTPFEQGTIALRTNLTFTPPAAYKTTTKYRPYLIDMNLLCPSSAFSISSSSACLLLTCGRSILFNTTTLYTNQPSLRGVITAKRQGTKKPHQDQERDGVNLAQRHNLQGQSTIIARRYHSEGEGTKVRTKISKGMSHARG